MLAQRASHPFRVFVVDDGSRDGTEQWTGAHFPQAEVLALPLNRGITAAFNYALQHARASQTPYVGLLNNDILLREDWLQRLVECAEAHPRAGAVGGKLMRLHQPELIDSAGDLIFWSGVAVNRGHLLPDRGQFDYPQEVSSVTAGAALYRREALQEVGDFETSFGAYAEDVDWGLRARLLGWSARYEPRALGFHVGSATTAGKFALAQRRNSLLVVIRCYPRELLIRWGAVILLGQLAQLLVAIGQGNGKRMLRAWWEVAQRLPESLRARREIQAAARVPARELDRVLWESLPPMSPLQRVLASLTPVPRLRKYLPKGLKPDYEALPSGVTAARSPGRPGDNRRGKPQSG